MKRGHSLRLRLQLLDVGNGRLARSWTGNVKVVGVAAEEDVVANDRLVVECESVSLIGVGDGAAADVGVVEHG